MADFTLSAERLARIEDILSRYPTKMAGCIPVLHLVQEEHGWVSEEAMQWVAKRLELSAAHVRGVVTFYTLFNQHPVGKHQLWVCQTLSCALNGSDQILHHCEKRLGVKPGETTADGKVTLRTAECLASCGTAPMVQVDRDFHENLDIPKLDALLDRLTR